MRGGVGCVGAFSFTSPRPPSLPSSLPFQHDEEARLHVKQEVIDALIKDNRFLDETMPLSFYEKDQRRLSFKGASKVGDWEREGAREGKTLLTYIYTHTKLIHPSSKLADNRVPP